MEWSSRPDFCELFKQIARHAPIYLFAFFGPLLLTLALTPQVRKLAIKLKMIDKPDPRRINTRPVPRGGGLAVVTAFLLSQLAIVSYCGLDFCRPITPTMTIAFAGAVILLTAIGFIDDKFSIPPLAKLIGQFITANILYFAGFSIDSIFVPLPDWLNWGLTCFWIIGAINAFNLIDGMDGLASGLALIASIGMAGTLFFSNQILCMIPYLMVAGACAGFLRFNFHPASIFLGDSGSMFLGLAMAVFPLATRTEKELIASLGVPLLIIGIPIFDTILAIWRRSIKRLIPRSMANALTADGIMQPDRNHIHHRVLKLFMNNQRKAAFALYAMAMLLVLLGIAGITMSGKAPGLYFIAFVVITIVVVKNMECMEIIDTCKLLSGEHIAKNRKLLVPVQIAVDIILMSTAVVAAWFISTDLLMPLRNFVKLILIYTAPTLIIFAGTRIYRRVWTRAQLIDYIVLSSAIVFGTLCSIGIVWLERGISNGLIRFSITYTGLSLLCLISHRLYKKCLLSIANLLIEQTSPKNVECERVLLYGVGLRMRSYLAEIFEANPRFTSAKKCIIVGLIDDNSLLKGQLIAGLDILGTGKELPNIVTAKKIDKVVITCDMPKERINETASLLSGTKAKLALWACEERII